jgi:membrane-associated phospholipid phosphatase
MPRTRVSSLRFEVSAAWALRAAVLCVIGLAGTWVIAELVPATHVKDAIALHDFTELGRPRVDVLASALLALLDPPVYAVWAGVLIAAALARGRRRVALASAVVLAFAPLSADLLKPLLAHSHAVYGVSEIRAASWPSGHSTAAMSLALCAVLVCPARLRTAAAALGTVFAVAVGFSLLLLAWHMPSDVFGGYLLAALWCSLAVAVLCRAEQNAPAGALGHVGEARGTLHVAERVLKGALVVGWLLAAAVVGAVFATHRSEAFAVAHLSLVIAAVGIATLAALLAWTFALALRA